MVKAFFSGRYILNANYVVICAHINAILSGVFQDKTIIDWVFNLIFGLSSNLSNININSKVILVKTKSVKIILLRLSPFSGFTLLIHISHIEQIIKEVEIGDIIHLIGYINRLGRSWHRRHIFISK
jgi:hypothetical protein